MLLYYYAFTIFINQILVSDFLYKQCRFHQSKASPPIGRTHKNTIEFEHQGVEFNPTLKRLRRLLTNQISIKISPSNFIGSAIDEQIVRALCWRRGLIFFSY